MSPAKLPTRKIGDADVTAIGYGAMNIAAAYGDVLSEEERFKAGFTSRFYVRSSDSNPISCSILCTSSGAPTGIQPMSTSIAKT